MMKQPLILYLMLAAFLASPVFSSLVASPFPGWGIPVSSNVESPEDVAIDETTQDMYVTMYYGKRLDVLLGGKLPKRTIYTSTSSLSGILLMHLSCSIGGNASQKISGIFFTESSGGKVKYLPLPLPANPTTAKVTANVVTVASALLAPLWLTQTYLSKELYIAEYDRVNGNARVSHWKVNVVNGSFTAPTISHLGNNIVNVGRPNGVAITRDDNVLFISSFTDGKIYKVKPLLHGTPITTELPLGSIGGPQKLLLHPLFNEENNYVLYIGDYMHGKISQYNASANQSVTSSFITYSFASMEGHRPHGISLLTNGTVLIISQDGLRVACCVQSFDLKFRPFGRMCENVMTTLPETTTMVPTAPPSTSSEEVGATTTTAPPNKNNQTEININTTSPSTNTSNSGPNNVTTIPADTVNVTKTIIMMMMNSTADNTTATQSDTNSTTTNSTSFGNETTTLFAETQFNATRTTNDNATSVINSTTTETPTNSSSFVFHDDKGPMVQFQLTFQIDAAFLVERRSIIIQEFAALLGVPLQNVTVLAMYAGSAIMRMGIRTSRPSSQVVQQVDNEVKDPNSNLKVMFKAQDGSVKAVMDCSKVCHVGNTLYASANAQQTGCECHCKNQYHGATCETCPAQFSGTSCDQCAEGYGGYPNCDPCEAPASTRSATKMGLLCSTTLGSSVMETVNTNCEGAYCECLGGVWDKTSKHCNQFFAPTICANFLCSGVRRECKHQALLTLFAQVTDGSCSLEVSLWDLQIQQERQWCFYDQCNTESLQAECSPALRTASCGENDTPMLFSGSSVAPDPTRLLGLVVLMTLLVAIF